MGSLVVLTLPPSIETIHVKLPFLAQARWFVFANRSSSHKYRQISGPSVRSTAAVLPISVWVGGSTADTPTPFHQRYAVQMRWLFIPPWPTFPCCCWAIPPDSSAFTLTGVRCRTLPPAPHNVVRFQKYDRLAEFSFSSIWPYTFHWSLSPTLHVSTLKPCQLRPCWIGIHLSTTYCAASIYPAAPSIEPPPSRIPAAPCPSWTIHFEPE